METGAEGGQEGNDAECMEGGDVILKFELKNTHPVDGEPMFAQLKAAKVVRLLRDAFLSSLSASPPLDVPPPPSLLPRKGVYKALRTSHFLPSPSPRVTLLPPHSAHIAWKITLASRLSPPFPPGPAIHAASHSSFVNDSTFLAFSWPSMEANSSGFNSSSDKKRPSRCNSRSAWAGVSPVRRAHS